MYGKRFIPKIQETTYYKHRTAMWLCWAQTIWGKQTKFAVTLENFLV